MKLLKRLGNLLGRSNSKGLSFSASPSPPTPSPSRAFNGEAAVSHGRQPASPSAMLATSSKHRSSLSPEFLHELEEVFRLFDSNGDGKISVWELGSVLRSLGDAQSEEELQEMVREVDIDGDGYVDLKEFVRLNTPSPSPSPSSSSPPLPACAERWAASPEELKDVFDVFDADRNGYITAEELHQVLLRLGDPLLTVGECHQMIQGVDADGDGLVNFEEFQRMMTNP